jgi:transposase
MKNKMMKGAHLTERKCKEIIRLFCEDLTATQIADVCGVSRVTINNYLKLIRTHIAKYCEEHNPRYRMAGALQFMPFMPTHAPAIADFSDDGLKEDTGWLYGISRYNQKLYVDLLSRQEYDQLLRSDGSMAFFAQEGQSEKPIDYRALIDISEWQMTKLTTTLQGGLQSLDDFDLFWSLAKSRLSKFRGLNRNTAYLHVKECEFRFNYRGEDLFKLLNFIIQRRPLHYSKVSAMD